MRWIKFLVSLALMRLVVGEAGAVAMGDSREALIAELGQPKSAIARGESEMLVYPGVARVLLQKNVVTVVEPLLPPPGSEAANGASSKEDETLRTEISRTARRDAVGAERMGELRREKPASPRVQPLTPFADSKSVGARASRGGEARKTTISRPTGGATARADEADELEEDEPEVTMTRLLVYGAIQAVVCAIAALCMLVAACRYWDVDMLVTDYLLCGALCGGAFFMAVILSDVVFPALFEGFVLTAKGKTMVASLFIAPTLVVALQRFSFNRDLGASVRVALLTSVWCVFALMALRAVLIGVGLALLFAS